MRLALAAAALLVPLLAGSAARADGLYVSESVGGTHFDNDLAAHVEDAVRIRVALGYRARQTSLEAWIGADVAVEPVPQGRADPDPVSFGIDLKRAFPVKRWLELYVRGSASRMQLSHDTLAGYGGRGLGFGAGAQIKGKAPILTMLYWPAAVVCAVLDRCKSLGPRATIAVFADQGYDFYRLHRDGDRSIDVEARRWTFGLAVGGDF
jgi:hypothetical protein